jgi:hypothetical protein
VGVAEVAGGNLQRGRDKTAGATNQEGTVLKGPRWGLCRDGEWGRLDDVVWMEENEEEGSGGGGGKAVLGEQSLEFPVVLLPVDDSVPRFRRIAEVENDD